MNKLAKVPGYKEQKYKQNIAKLDDVKTVSQNRELIYGPGGAAGQTSEVKDKTPGTHAKTERIPTGHITFPKPKKPKKSCRIRVDQLAFSRTMFLTMQQGEVANV